MTKKVTLCFFIEQLDEMLLEFYADLKTEKARIESALFVDNIN